MDTGINTTPVVASNQEPINIGTNTTPMLTPPVASARASKATLGLANALQQTHPQIYDSIFQNEDAFRQEAASAVDYKRSADKQQNLVTAVQNGASHEDIKTLLKPTPPSDPGSVIEEHYGKAFVSPLTTASSDFMRNTFMSQLVKENPEQAEALSQVGADLIAKNEYSLKKSQEMDEVVKQQSWLGWGLQVSETLVPGRYEAFMRGNTPGVGILAGGLLGENLEDQRKAAMRMPLPEYKKWLDTTVDKLKAINPNLASDWVQAIHGQSTSDQTMHDIFTGLDATAIGGLGKIFLRGSKNVLFGKATQAVQDVVQSSAAVRTAEPEISAEEAAWKNEGGAIRKPIEVVQPAAHGDIGTAAVKQATNNLTEDLNNGAKPVSRAMQALPSVYKKDLADIKTNPGNFGQDIVNRLEQETNQHIDRFKNLIETSMRVNNVPELTASEDLIKNVKAQAEAALPNRMENSIVNVTGPHFEKETGTWHLNQILSRPTGELFGDEKEAQIWAKINKLPDTTTYQQGAGWYLTNKVPINPTSDMVRDALGTTDYSKLPHSLFDNIIDATLGWIRTPDETMAMDDRIGRKIASYAPERFMRHAKETMQSAANISPGITKPQNFKKWNDWKRLLESQQHVTDPDTGKPGYWMKSPGEVEDWYSRNVGRLPDQDEISAYFAAKRLGADDLYFRRALKYRNAYNAGAHTNTISYIKDETGQKFTSNPFEGVRRYDLPKNNVDIAIVPKRGEVSLRSGTGLGAKARKEAEDDIKSGKAHLIEVYDPDTTPLKGFGGITGNHHVRYVLSYDLKTSPLDFEAQVPRTGGIHYEYDYPHYIKKANVVTDPVTREPRYKGDHTIMAVPNRAMGKGIAEKLNAVDKLIEDGKIPEAKQLYESNFKTADNVPASWEEHYANYNPSTNSDGVPMPARLGTKEPYMVVDRDSSIIGVDKTLEKRYPSPSDPNRSLLVDGTRSGSLARQNQVQFTKERDSYQLLEAQDKGTRNNPVYHFAPAKLVDPVAMLNRGYSRIVNNTYMDPYKSKAMEHWLFGDADGMGNGAEHYLKASKAEIRAHPFYYFNEPEYKKDVDPKLWSLMEQQRFKVKSFASIPSKIDTMLDSVAQNLSDSIYNVGGAKALKLDPTWMIPKLKDGPRFIRSMVFHPKMGMFNPAQYFVHAMGYAISASFAGLRPAGGGAFAGILHGFMNMNHSPEILEHMDELATRLPNPGGYTWKPGQFKEAHQGMMNSGFNLMSDTKLASLDAPLSGKIIQNAAGKALQTGEAPFRAGVSTLKIPAWYTAYLEFRNGGGGKFKWAAHPTGKLTDEDWGQVLERADMLTHNMTRASTSVVQKGMLSFGMQFGGFDLRVMELLTGKRLTWQERVRLFGTYQVLFGARAMAGIAGLAGVATTMGDEAGYQPGANLGSTALMEGGLATAGALATGGGDIRKGNVYNVGARYGMHDLSMVDNALDTDPTVWKIFGGAPESELSNIWAESSPFRSSAISLLKGDNSFKLTPNDYTAFLKEIASFNAADRAYWELTQHRYYNKTGKAVDSNVGTPDALFMAGTGLLHQDWTDLWPKILEIRSMKNREDQARTQALKNYSLFLQATKDGDVDNATTFGKRARFYLQGYPEDKWNQMVAEAARENEDLIRSINRQRYDAVTNKNIPSDKASQYRDILHEIIKLQEERKSN